MISEHQQRLFWKKVKKTRRCWLWIGGKNDKGYGHFSVRKQNERKTFRSHRVSYSLSRGEILPGFLILHTCDNPACVNPKHLWLGTARDNMVDCVTKGRHQSKSLIKKYCDKCGSERVIYKLKSGKKSGRIMRRCKHCRRKTK
jgi:hypothetical protein